MAVVLSSFGGAGHEASTAPMIAPQVIQAPESAAPAEGVKAATEAALPAPEIITTETKVRSYFKDTPILAEISRCESHFRQWDTNGNIIRGIVNSSDVGVMQINEFYHGKEARNLGLDLHTLEGNMAFAKILYEKEGTKPWSASAACWNK